MSVRSDPHRAVPGAARAGAAGRLATHFLVSAAALQVCADALTGTLGELWELARARVNDRLDLLLWLLRDRHYPVEVLVHEEADEHLESELVNINIHHHHYQPEDKELMELMFE